MAVPNTPSAAYRMLSIPDALDLVLKETQQLEPVTVPFQDALHQTLALDVLAAEPVPGFRASIKDGYAVVSSDGPGEYRIAYDVHAGSAPATLEPGTVAYIATGGVVPDGADAVVQIEDTIFLGKEGEQCRVKILRQVSPGEDIRAIGSDMAQNQVVLTAGHHIGAPEIGILATVGATHIQVHKQAHVAVLSTGDEVCEPSAPPPLQPGQIRDANRAMLLASAAGTGARVTDLGIARDSADVVEAALDKAIAAGADILLTTGGVSMGDKDFIKPLLERRGEIFFGKVRMKPGKPLTFAKVPTGAMDANGNPKYLLVFGLPGNPVSSVVTFHLVVVPCLRKMSGWKIPYLRRVYCKIAAPIKMDPERPEYHRAIARWVPTTTTTTAAGDGHAPLSGELVAESTGGQISSRLLSLKSANVLLEIPQAKGTIAAGSVVSALVIGDMAEMVVKEAVGETDLKRLRFV